MPGHDYYADQTVFDRFYAQLQAWLCRQRCSSLRTYAWSIGFSVLGISSFLVACGLLAWGLQVRWFSDLPVGMNDALVRTLTVLLALFASSQLCKQAVRALPQDFPLPAFFFSGQYRIELLVISGVSAVAPFTLLSAAFLATVDLAAIVALVLTLSAALFWYRRRSRVSDRPRVAAVAEPAACQPVTSRASPADEGNKIHDFLSKVRAAGVNVSIARALFTAGIRSEKHLRRADDRALLEIHGVGPATVRKLRACFRQEHQHAG